MWQFGKKLWSLVLLLFAHESLAVDDYIVSAIIKNLSTGEVILSKNADLRLPPASTLKLFTAHIALKELGGEYRYETALYEHGDTNYVKFSGDPTFTLSNLQELLTKAKHKKLIIDNSAFYSERASNGRSFESQKFCYGAPSNSVIINSNCSTLTLKDGRYTADSSWKVNLKLNYRIHASELCHLDLAEDGENGYSLNGCTKALPVQLRIAIPNPDKLLLSYLRAQGYIAQFGVVPEEMSKVHSIYSQPLSVMVKDMLKSSDNIAADSMIKAAASHRYGVQGSFHLASMLMNSEALALTDANVNLIDGSGVSAKNFVTTKFMAILLEMMYTSSQQDVFPARILNLGPESKMGYVKTGTLDNLSAISGFVEINGVNYAFSFTLANHSLSKVEINNQWLNLFSVIYAKKT